VDTKFGADLVMLGRQSRVAVEVPASEGVRTLIRSRQAPGGQRAEPPRAFSLMPY
jgi:hypothetical protein